VGVGIYIFNVKISGNPLLFWLILSAGALCFMSIGFALTGLMKTARTSTPVTQMTYFIMMFLGGVFFPNSMLPKALEPIANALPSAQMSTALRQVLYEHAGIGDVWRHLVVIALWVVVSYLISLKVFRWE
jgi:ABC-2 type transport system permease protein